MDINSIPYVCDPEKLNDCHLLEDIKLLESSVEKIAPIVNNSPDAPNNCIDQIRIENLNH